jgi:hypothetical protein
MRATIEHAIFLDAGFAPDTWGALAQTLLQSPLLAVDNAQEAVNV